MNDVFELNKVFTFSLGNEINFLYLNAEDKKYTHTP